MMVPAKAIFEDGNVFANWGVTTACIPSQGAFWTEPNAFDVFFAFGEL